MFYEIINIDEDRVVADGLDLDQALTEAEDAVTQNNYLTLIIRPHVREVAQVRFMDGRVHIDDLSATGIELNDISFHRGAE